MIADRILTVEPLTAELRVRGRIPAGSPARFAVVQRDGCGTLLAVKKATIQEEDARSFARIFANLGEGKYIR